MHKMKILMTVSIAAALLAGCSGEYILTIGDQVATAGQSAAAVARLQQNEFAGIRRDIEGVPLRFYVENSRQRGAFTDELGYAGTMVPVPEEPGIYRMHVTMQNNDGDTARTHTPVTVYDPEASIVAIDLDALPDTDDPTHEDAVTALQKLTAKAELLYLTRQDAYDIEPAKRKIRRADYPEGPVLTWRREYRYVARSGPLKLPRIVTESRLVGQLGYLRQALPNIEFGICSDVEAAQAFKGAEITPILVDPPANADMKVPSYKTWEGFTAQWVAPGDSE